MYLAKQNISSCTYYTAVVPHCGTVIYDSTENVNNPVMLFSCHAGDVEEPVTGMTLPPCPPHTNYPTELHVWFLLASWLLNIKTLSVFTILNEPIMSVVCFH